MAGLSLFNNLHFLPCFVVGPYDWTMEKGRVELRIHLAQLFDCCYNKQSFVSSTHHHIEIFMTLTTGWAYHKLCGHTTNHIGLQVLIPLVTVYFLNKFLGGELFWPTHHPKLKCLNISFTNILIEEQSNASNGPHTVTL